MRELYTQLREALMKGIANARNGAIGSLQSGSVEPARDLAHQAAGLEAALKLLEEMQAKLERD